MNNWRICAVSFMTFILVSLSSNVSIDTRASNESLSNLQPTSLPPIYFTWEIGSDCRTVVFTSSVYHSSNYSWDFTSDGIIDAWCKTAAHTYTQSGVYNVTHCAMVLGSLECVSFYVYVTPPEANFDWTINDLSVTFQDQSFDCDGDLSFWGWDFTDDGIFDAFGETVTYAFSVPGTYNVTLVVEDNDLFVGMCHKNVTISQSLPDLACTGSLHWPNVKPKSTQSGTFSLMNVGDSGSTLDWSIQSYPAWGIWSCSPSTGTDLTPEQGSVTVTVTLTAPEEKNQQYAGELKIINTKDPSDYEMIQVSLGTPRYASFFMGLEERCPRLFYILSLAM